MGADTKTHTVTASGTHQWGTELASCSSVEIRMLIPPAWGRLEGVLIFGGA